MAESLNITCPDCNTTYLLPRQNVGKKLRCSKCKALFKITDESIEKDEKEVLVILQEQLKENDKKLKQIRKQNLEYQDEVIKLKQELEAYKNDDEQESRSFGILKEGLETLTIQIDSKNEIIYVNTQFCDYIKAKKQDLMGEHYSILSRWIGDTLYKAIKKPIKGEISNQIVKDEQGNVFDVRINFKSEILHIQFQDISDEQKFKQFVQRYVPYDLSNLHEEDLQTFKYPERRFMSVSCTDLRGFTSLSESMNPMDVRTTMNAYLESIIHAIDSNYATVDKIVGDEVIAIYGAPRYYSDHALRAIKTACEMMVELKALQVSFSKFGKKIPNCSIGINTGEMVIGTMGSSTRQDYSVLGNAVHLATRLCRISNESTVIITEATLKAALQSIPENWDIEETTSLFQEVKEHEHVQMVYHPLAPELHGKTISVGPMVKTDPEDYEFLFEYLYAIEAAGISKPLPVIGVKSKDRTVQLSLDNDHIAKQEGDKFFGKYRLLHVIGRGGMGEVWKAKDTYGNVVALKMLLAGEEATESQLKRFKQEADIMGRLHHPNICRIYEVGKVDKVTYIAMEYIEGVSLSTLLRYRGDGEQEYGTLFPEENYIELDELVVNVQTLYEEEGEVEGDVFDLESESEAMVEKNDPKEDRVSFVLPLNQTLSILVKVCEAVQSAHKMGVMHRDIKPGNIMIRPDGHPVVMDFGLAKVNDEEDQRQKMKRSLSVSGQVVGTIDYMSPEQALSSKDVNEQTDVYAIGALMYQMVTGRKHFIGSGNMITDAQRLQDHVPVKPSAINKNIDYNLELITLKALQNSPAKRYRTVNALKFDLNRFSRGHLITAKSESQWLTFVKLIKKNKTAAYILLSAVTVIITVTGWYVHILKENFEKSRLESENASKTLSSLSLIAADWKMEQKRTKRWLYSQSLLERAKIHAEQGEYIKAINLAEQAVDNSDDWDQGWYFLGKFKQAVGLHLEANLAFKEAKKQMCEEEDFPELIKISNEKISIQNKAVTRFNESNARNRLKADHFDELGNAFRDIGKHKEAIEHYHGAMERYQREGQTAQAKITALKVRLTRFKMLNLNNSNFGAFQLNEDGSVDINLMRHNIYDLSPLIGLKIRQLDLSYGKIIGLIDLEHLDVEELILSHSNMQDLSRLASGKMISLNLSGTGVYDLSPLKNLKLRSLDLSNTKVSNINPIKELKLFDLNILGTAVSYFEPLKYIRTLRHLKIDGKNSKKLKSFSMNNLETLTLVNFKSVESFRWRTINGTRICKLKEITFKNCSDVNLGWMDLAPLKMFIGHDCNFQELHELKESKTLEMVDLSGSRNVDLESIKGLKLKTLILKGARIKNVEALKSTEVESLNLSGITNIMNFSFLKELKTLRVLNVSKTQFRDLSILQNLPLETLIVDLNKNIQSLDALNDMEQLLEVGESENKLMTRRDALEYVKKLN